jgi:hypothetical protein
MASHLFNRYIWLIDTIHRSGKITFEDLNTKWLQNPMSGGDKIPPRTFHNHRTAIEKMFDIHDTIKIHFYICHNFICLY